MSVPALILFSHGSLLCGADRLINQHAERLRESGIYCAVETGYLNYATPTIEEAISRCAGAGATRIVIVPYFLVAGVFVTRELPARLTEVVKEFPDINFKIARAIEDEPLMLQAVEQVISSAIGVSDWQGRAIAQAKADCQLRVDCPLYKSPLCRAYAE